MIVVRVELHSAITGQVTELARMEIVNDGVSEKPTKGNYLVRTLRGRSTADLDRRTTHKSGRVSNWPRLALHVWNLVATSLTEMGYGKP